MDNSQTMGKKMAIMDAMAPMDAKIEAAGDLLFG